ncbi:MAG: flagellar protein FlaG [Desulfobacteria bacterium]|nr:flagellar protein FlaG [Deltaproteobacteria bacterium]
MDVKGDMALPMSPPVVAGPSGNAAAGKHAPPPPPTGKEAGTRTPDNAEVQKVVREALKIEPLPNRELRIEFESDLHRIVVKVMDKESGEVIRQIPMPEALAIAKNIRAQLGRMAREQRAVAVDQEV